MELTPRVPPHSNDAEISVLGSVLLDNDTLSQLGDTVAPEMFYREGHRKIFAAMRTLQERGEPVDLVTLSEDLRGKGQLDEVGGLTYLIGLSDQVPTAAYAEHYARIVGEKHTLRQLISASGKAMQLAYDAQLPLEDLLDRAEKMIFEVAEHKKKGEASQAMGEVVHDTFEYITLLHQNKGIPDGVSSGFKDLDEQISGLQKGSLNVLAARPSMGKTAFALSIAQNVALRGEKTVAVFSLEMPSVQLALRMLCSEARVDMNRIRSGQLNERDFERLAHAAGRLAEAPMVIDDEPDLTAQRAAQQVAAHGRPARSAGPGGHRLPAADVGRQELGRQRQPPAGDQHHLARPQGPGPRDGGADHRAESAQSARWSSGRTTAPCSATCGNPARSSRTPTS